MTYARSAGARAARGDFFLFCDADDVADPGWIEAMARAAPSCDGAGGYLEEERLNDARVRSWRSAATPGCLPGDKIFLPYPFTANAAVRADVYRELGGFNPVTGRTYEPSFGSSTDTGKAVCSFTKTSGCEVDRART